MVADQRMRGIRRLIRAWGNSVDGLRACFRHEESFRLEVVAVVLLTPVALWLGETAVERILLMGSLFVILVVELLNSAVEAVVDRFGTERHELSGRAKDAAAAAVLLTLLLAALTWGLVLATRW